jgi:hypothetical protein
MNLDAEDKPENEDDDEDDVRIFVAVARRRCGA